MASKTKTPTSWPFKGKLADASPPTSSGFLQTLGLLKVLSPAKIFNHTDREITLRKPRSPIEQRSKPSCGSREKESFPQKSQGSNGLAELGCAGGKSTGLHPPQRLQPSHSAPPPVKQGRQDCFTGLQGGEDKTMPRPPLVQGLPPRLRDVQMVAVR